MFMYYCTAGSDTPPTGTQRGPNDFHQLCGEKLIFFAKNRLCAGGYGFIHPLRRSKSILPNMGSAGATFPAFEASTPSAHGFPKMPPCHAVSPPGIVMVLFFGIFDIIAMQLFGGRLGSCLDPLGVYTDSEVYVPGFECIEKEACTFQHITGFSETFPPADLYNRTVLSGDYADTLETHAAQVGCCC